MNYLVDSETLDLLVELGSSVGTSRAYRTGFYREYPESYKGVNRLSLRNMSVMRTVLVSGEKAINLTIDQVKELYILPTLSAREEYIKVLATELSTQ